MPVFVSYIFKKEWTSKNPPFNAETQVQSLVCEEIPYMQGIQPVCHNWKEAHDPQGGSRVLQLNAAVSNINKSDHYYILYCIAF